MYLVYIAAGKSSRFGGSPKLLAKIGPNGETLIEISIQQALTCININKIHFLVSKETYPLIFQHLGEKYHHLPITYSFQEIPSFRTKPWGTADAVASLKGVINETFIMCNSDDLYGKKAFSSFVNDKTNIIVGYLLENSLPIIGKVNRGFININKHYSVENLEEKLNIEMDDFTQQELMSILVSMNIFQFTPKILDLLYQNVEQFKKDNHENETIEALLPNFLNELINQDKIEILCKVCSERCVGITYKEDIERIKKDLIR